MSSCVVRCLYLALVACTHEAAHETSAPLPVASSPLTVVDAHVARPSPYAPVAQVLESPDKVEAFALSTRDFLDSPPGTAHRITGYPIHKPLPPPPDSFVHAFASIVLAEDAYRREAVLCSLGVRHIGFRFTRGSDIVEISILAKCPSVSGTTTTIGRTGGQLEGDGADRLAALLHATYPEAFSR